MQRTVLRGVLAAARRCGRTGDADRGPPGGDHAGGRGTGPAGRGDITRVRDARQRAARGGGVRAGARVPGQAGVKGAHDGFAEPAGSGVQAAGPQGGWSVRPRRASWRFQGAVLVHCCSFRVSAVWDAAGVRRGRRRRGARDGGLGAGGGRQAAVLIRSRSAQAPCRGTTPLPRIRRAAVRLMPGRPVTQPAGTPFPRGPCRVGDCRIRARDDLCPTSRVGVSRTVLSS